MQWQQSLQQIISLAIQVQAAAMAAGTADPAAVWEDPEVRAAGNRLLLDVSGSESVSEILEASEQLRAEHAAILARPPHTEEDLVRLGILSAAAYALSSKAMVEAESAKALVCYTVTQVLPWLLRLAHMGMLLAEQDPVRPQLLAQDLQTACTAGLDVVKVLQNSAASQIADACAADFSVKAREAAEDHADRGGKLLPFPAPRDGRAGAVAALRELVERIEAGTTRGVVVMEFTEDDQGNRWWVSGNVTSDTVVINLERVKRDLLG